jgi:beta-lactamase regulating signal transducer with metallopeptidase domain
MASALFSRVMNMSLTASVVILAVLALRLLLKKAPKIFSYALWAVVLFRLLCPVSFSSPLSLFGAVSVPAVQSAGVTAVSNSAAGAKLPAAVANFPAADSAQTVSGQTASQGAAQTAQVPQTPAKTVGLWDAVKPVLPDVWLAGAAAMLFVNLASLLHLRRKLVGAVRLEKNIYLADHIATPFVFGLFRPRIYLPSALAEPERAAIVLHEQTHIRRRDYFAKILAFAALAIHWFNPLVWLSFSLMEKDMEMSCDEAVLRKMGTGVRGEYSESLLRLATGRKMLSAPIAFGEGATKGRIKNVMNYKKPALWAIVLAFAVCAVGCVSLGANQTAAAPTATPASQTVSPDFDDALVSDAIHTHNASLYPSDGCAGAGCKVLDAKTDGSTVTMYLLTMYGVYDVDAQSGDATQVAGSGVVPAVLKFTADADGSYALADYQETAEGSGFEASVQQLFPEDLTNEIQAQAKADALSRCITVTPTPSPTPLTGQAAALDTAIAKAVLSHNADSHADGECAGEGHIVLGSETSGSAVTVYALAQYGEYQFQDGNFVKTSGTGAIPAVLTFTVNSDGSYSLTDYQEPDDGSGYEASVKKLFPEDLQARCLSIGQSDADALKTQERAYATAYLTSIGRSATVGETADFQHTLLTDKGVPVSVSNSLLSNTALANYPQWIGNLERLESGARYVYAVAYDAQNQTISYTKTGYVTKEVVESYVFDSATGNQVSTGSGSGTAATISQ